MPEKKEEINHTLVEEGVDRLTLQVSVQIIKHISSGLYRSPASAIKELVSNAFDAEATEVTVNFKFQKENTSEHHIKSVSVEDNGSGIELDDIYRMFTHIGASSKTPSPEEGGPDAESLTKEMKRPVIGRLGIGMLAIASACYSFVVRTKREGDETEYIAYINLTYFEDIMNATETMEKLSIGNVELKSVKTGNINGSYTKVQFSDFKPPFMENLDREIERSYIFSKSNTSNKDEEQYFRSFLKDVLEREKISKLQTLDNIALEVALMSPVEYLSDGPVRSVVKLKDGTDYEVPGTNDKLYLDLKKRLKNYKFNVFFNITVDWIIDHSKNKFKLFKPLLYPLDEDVGQNQEEMKELDPYIFTFGPVNAEVNDGKGNLINTEINAYLYHQNGALKPHEFRGILFRVHNVAIGKYFADELRLYSENPIILHQTLMEIYLDKGFQSIVNLDREGLYEGSNTFRHLFNFLENFLNGKVPERPSASPPSTKSEEVSPAKEFREKQEEHFAKTQKQVFKPREGVIKIIKRRMRKIRETKRKKTSPLDIILGEYENRQKTHLKVKRLDEFDGNYKVDRLNDATEVYIPRFEGTRSKLWDSLFISALLSLDYNDKKTREFLILLIKIYETSEGKTIS